MQRLEVVSAFRAKFHEFLCQVCLSVAVKSFKAASTYLDPFETAGGIGRGSHTELVTLFTQRSHVLLPKGNGIFGRNVGLRDLVGSVEKG